MVIGRSCPHYDPVKFLSLAHLLTMKPTAPAFLDLLLLTSLAVLHAPTAAVERPAKKLIESGRDMLYPGRVRNNLRNINDNLSSEKFR